jgi:hypothetical protein
MDDFSIGIQIELERPEDFLLVKESLTRIGIALNKTKTLYQTAHILHKRGKYYICHFKELFTLDGKHANITQEDIERRNLIAGLLADWNLIKIKDPSTIKEKAPLNSVKILSFKDKNTWTLVPKYTLGEKR